MHNLTFRITGRQLRNLGIGAVVITAIAAASGLAVVGHSGPGGGPLGYAIGLGIGALIYLYALVAYAVARTECTPADIRTRGLGGPRSCGWADVRDVSVRYGKSRIVVVTTAGGRRFWLGAPVDGGIMPDPDLAAKVAQIRGYWHTAVTGSPEGVVAPVWLPRGRGAGVPPGTGPGLWLKVLAAITAPWVLLSCALVFAIVISPFTLRDIGPAWSAHLGHGQPGTFTAVTESCSRTCSWYGDFTTDSGYTRTNVLFGSGNHITQVGDQVAAVDTGDPKVVYPAGGGSDWIWATVIVAAQIITVSCVPIYLIRKLRRRRARQSPPGVPAPAHDR